MLDARFAALKDASRREPYPPASARRSHLRNLERVLVRRQEDIAAAIGKDFGGRHRVEVLFSEIYVALTGVRHAWRHTGEWMAERPRPLDWPLWPARAYILPQPLGVVGIIVPWNYPIFLSIAPLAAALAAGNRVLIKMPELTPATNELLAAILHEALPEDVAGIITGDAEVGRAFSALPFDHLLFTGSTAVGREVMRAAADNLTPVTLELGGKSPAIVTDSAHIKRAAEDIAYGKFLNAGQTCIAPDYILVDRRRVDAFVDALLAAVDRYWPSHDFTSIISPRHASHITSYVEEAVARGVRVIRRGPASILVDPPADLAVMREEIFGPVLPVKPYDTLDAAIGWVNANPRPLALYLFSRDGDTIDRVMRETISGGVTVNDTLLHIAAEDLPFGGIGPSGMGHYHGRDGFDTFSKLKPILRRRLPGLGRSLRPPYGRMHELLRRLLLNQH